MRSKMKFIDYIFEFAYNQNDALSRIEDQLTPLTSHILKCLAMPQSQDYQHWIGEIANITNIIDQRASIKTKSGRISKKVLQKEFERPTNESSILKAIKTIEIQYSIKTNPQNHKLWIKIIKNFYDDFFAQISEDNFDIYKCFKLLNLEV